MRGEPRDAVGEFAVQVEHVGERLLVEVIGELDLLTTPALTQAVPDVPLGGHCVIDLREVPFMDSTAVHALIAVHQRACDEGWTLAILRVPGSLVDRLLEHCGMSARVELLG
ncbi:MAG TPA: STAS domain-containing protein [Solirubrobacteraceae bacterium]|nr:STAS domain-containing protein [Solirubrobacteraceae bacterium]